MMKLRTIGRGLLYLVKLHLPCVSTPSSKLEVLLAIATWPEVDQVRTHAKGRGGSLASAIHYEAATFSSARTVINQAIREDQNR